MVSDGLVILGREDGLPQVGDYVLAMRVRHDAGQAVKAVADQMRAAFESLATAA